MERIYKIATGDFVDLSRIIAIGKLVKYDNGIFEIPIYCELHSEPILPLFLSAGDGSQPNEGFAEVTKIRDEIINGK